MRFFFVFSLPGTFNRLICDIYFERSLGYYLYQIYVPAFLIVLISWVPFWLDQEDNHARVGLGVTTVLTITTLTTSTIATLPKISYIKAIDIYLFTCFIMVFLSLIEYASVGFVESKRRYSKRQQIPNGKQKSAQYKQNDINNEDYKQATHSDTSHIDRYSRIIFPLVFFAFNMIYAGTIAYIESDWKESFYFFWGGEACFPSLQI